MRKSIWRPLHKPVFRMFWIAALVSNIGTWMHDVGAAWLMTTLTRHPVMVSLLQTAIFLPFFLMALPAGALADVFDRRRLLVAGHIWMSLSAMGLALLALTGVTDPWLLLALTFALGLGAAVSAPAWNAVTPELVSRADLANAVALGSVSWNVARGIGSVIGGLVVALAGPGAVFLLNGVSFLGLIVFFFRWRRQPVHTFAHKEGVLEAMKAGVRYVRHAPELGAVLFRCALFTASGSAFWALLPRVWRVKLGCTSFQYGLALGLFGAGTLAGAYLMPRARRWLSLDHCSAVGTVVFAGGVIGLACAGDVGGGFFFMLVAGAAWIFVNSCLHLAVQLAAPAWVRARAMAFYIIVSQGSVALGSVMWGAMAAGSDLAGPLVLSAMALVLGIFAIVHFPLVEAEKLDVSISRHWDEPEVSFEPNPEDGPVLVSVEYLIDPPRYREFKEAMSAVRLQRLRDGAFQWHLFHDLSNPGRYVETYFIESWAEHMRQHERVTVTDRLTEERAIAFHTGQSPPLIRHYISAYANAGASQGQPAPGPGYQLSDYRYLTRM